MFSTWTDRTLEEIFLILPGKRLESKNMIEGKTPFIGASELNNGITNFVSNHNISKDKNVLGVNYNGSVCIGFFHPYECIFSDDVKRFHFKDNNDTKENFLFFITLIQLQKRKYNYAYKFNHSRMSRQKILIPCDENSNINYGKIKTFINNIEKTKLNKYIKYAKKSMLKIEYKDIEPLKHKKWKEFFISDICFIESGCDIYDMERIDGNTPYITSSAINNGIKYFVGNTNGTLESNCISVNRNGSVGYSFYHKYKALYSNDCRKLRLKLSNNEYIYLFITNQIMKQKDKYNYSVKMGTGRLKKQKIMLPINEFGLPDYDYMEQYIKNMMYKKYQSYLKYKNNHSN